MEFILIILFVAVLAGAMFMMMISAVLTIGAAWLALIVLQLLIGALLKALTGKKPGWLMSRKTFIIEAIIVFAIAIIYFRMPVDSGTLIPEEYASITYSAVDDNGGEGKYIAHAEQEEAVMTLVKSYTLHRRLNLRFLNEGAVMHDYSGIFLYFWDEDGELIEKVRVYGDLFGISKKEDGEFIYYRSEGVMNEDIYQEIFYMEKRANVYDIYEEELTALNNSLDYEDGTVYLTIPEWSTDDWSLSIDARIAVLDENGEKIDTDYIRYLEDRYEANDWMPNETVSFELLEAPHEKLSYTVTVEGYHFERIFLLSKIEERYVYPEHEG